MLAMHGAFFLQVKTEGHLQQRARKAGCVMAVLVIALFIAGGCWVNYAIDGYRLTSNLVHDGPSNPLYKTAIRASHAWLTNYTTMPFTMTVPLAGIVGAFLAMVLAKRPKVAFVASAMSIAGIIGTVGVSMFPFILPSSSDPSQSLTVWDSSSSQLTLLIMLGATIIFLPIVLAYTAWVYRVLAGKITEQSIRDNDGTAY